MIDTFDEFVTPNLVRFSARSRSVIKIHNGNRLESRKFTSGPDDSLIAYFDDGSREVVLASLFLHVHICRHRSSN